MAMQRKSTNLLKKQKVHKLTQNIHLMNGSSVLHFRKFVSHK